MIFQLRKSTQRRSCDFNKKNLIGLNHNMSHIYHVYHIPESIYKTQQIYKEHQATLYTFHTLSL